MTERVKQVVVKGAGEDGKDLLQYVDSVTDEVIKEVTLEPKEEVTEHKEKKVQDSSVASPRVIREARPLLIPANEMTRRAIKKRQDTVGRKIEEICVLVLAHCEENLLSGSYTYLFEEDEEVDLSVIKSIIRKLRELEYTVRKKEGDDGTSITVKWPTTIRKTTPVSTPKQEDPKPEVLKKKKRGRNPKKTAVLQEEEMPFQIGNKKN